MRRLAVGIASLLVSLCACGNAAQPQASPFQNGDRVCFVGDSITHIGTYHAYLQLFYATRYPDRDIAYFNCGHSGGSSDDCLRRLNWDVLDHKPTVAMVMFGMNDMAGLYGDPAKSPDDANKAIAARVASVQASYAKLLDQLTSAGARLILVGPSIYDDTAVLDAKVERSNLAMTQWTAEVGQIAARRRAAFADLGGAMNPINARLQASDPKATLVSGDRVHPGAVGNAVMVYTILKSQDVEPYVARIAVDAASGRSEGSYHCAVESIRRENRGLTFTCREDALPFVLPADASKALDLVPLTDEFNREMLTVSGLPTGRYELRIDDASVGEYSAGELAAGVNLATNAKTPQYRQSAALAEINTQRNTCEAQSFRTKAFLRHCYLNAAGVDPGDDGAIERFLKAGIEDKSIDGFGRHMAQFYLKDVAPHWDETVKRHAELVARMKADRQPKPHQFNLQRVDPARDER